MSTRTRERERHWKKASRRHSSRRHRRRPNAPVVSRRKTRLQARRRLRHQARRRLVRGLLVLGALAVVAIAALTVIELMAARNHLSAARSLMQGVARDPGALTTPEGRAAAIAATEGAIDATARAERRLSGSPVLSLLRPVPRVSAQRTGLLDLTADARTAADAAHDLLTTIDDLAEQTEVVDGRAPLAGLRSLQRAMSAASRQLATISPGGAGLWGPLHDARREFDTLVVDTTDRLRNGAEAVDASLTFMGSEERRRYLLAIQNNAEMRDQGMVLSYAVLTFEGGHLSIDSSGSVLDLALPQPATTPVPPGTQEVFGPLQPSQLWQSVNASADFALSGQLMVDMYSVVRGERLDGVIAVDVPALALLLSAVGPVQVPGIGPPITAQNVGKVLLHDLYQGFSRDEAGERRERLDEVTRAVVQRLTTGRRNSVQIGQRLADAARGLHLRLWSAHGDEEEVFERTGLGGGPAVDDPHRTFHVAVQNRTATKLDYFIRTTVRHDVQLTDAGDAVISTTVVVDNQAPPDGEPSYQLGPSRYQSRPGEYHAWLLLWAPAGSQSTGEPVPESGLELTHRVAVVDPGTQREFHMATTTIPHAVQDGRLELRLVPQPRLQPAHLEVNLRVDGWQVDGPRSWSGPWDRVVRTAWDVRR